MASALNFVAGTVASGKTLELVLRARQIQSAGLADRLLILKPSIDTRFSARTVKSATGLHVAVSHLISPVDDIARLSDGSAVDFAAVDFIFVDEVQFFTGEQVRQLRRISLEHDIEIVCFGLLKDFRCNIFPSSAILLEVCDDIRTVKTVCMRCAENRRKTGSRSRAGQPARMATCSMRVCQDADGRQRATLSGNSISIGGIEKYIPVCYDCYQFETQAIAE